VTSAWELISTERQGQAGRRAIVAKTFRAASGRCLPSGRGRGTAWGRVGDAIRSLASRPADSAPAVVWELPGLAYALD